MILGIDEVGRGPWAGPLVVGAVVLGGKTIEGLTDSKKLSKKRREELSQVIHGSAEAVGLGWVSADEIDEIGLSASLKLATIRAVEQIHAPYHEIIIDGTINFLAETTKGKYVTTLAKADLLIPCVSAASIVAKVARDAYMAAQDDIYPGYGFGAHAGYGVAKHRAAIEQLGVTPLHRLSFAPLAKYREPREQEAVLYSISSKIPTARAIGNESESVAESYLIGRGHVILDRNWRTKWCEIDIVSLLGDCYYFTEVKHRKDDRHGSGLEAITPRKQNQMAFAARMYMSSRPDYNMRLAAVATAGTPPAVTEYLEL